MPAAHAAAAKENMVHLHNATVGCTNPNDKCQEKEQQKFHLNFPQILKNCWKEFPGYQWRNKHHSFAQYSARINIVQRMHKKNKG